MLLAGFDQGAGLTGWCVGDGSRTPLAGAWRFDNVKGGDVGALGWAYRERLGRLYREHQFTHVVYEAPLLSRHRDRVIDLRRRFGIDMILEEFCVVHGVVLQEQPFGRLKRELTASPHADKDAMVAAAVRHGVALPKTKADGREDAADAFAAWLIAVRLWAKRHRPLWDDRKAAAQGALI